MASCSLLILIGQGRAHYSYQYIHRENEVYVVNRYIKRIMIDMMDDLKYGKKKVQHDQ